MRKLELVPWSCKQEWEFCRDKLFGEDVSMKEKALQHAYIWKARSPNLPVSIECTIILLEVYLKEMQSKAESAIMTKTMSFESWYSMAIMRFLNLITDSNVGNKPVSSMNTLAKQFGIPEWIVKIRHSAAHGHSLPSLLRLREAAEFCLKWLFDNYWCKDSYEDVNTTETNKVGASFTLLCYEVCQILVRCIQRGFTNFSDVESTDRDQIQKIISRRIRDKEKEEIDSISLKEIYEIALIRLTRHLQKDVKNAKTLIDHILQTDERLMIPDAFDNHKLRQRVENEWNDILSALCNSPGCFCLIEKLASIVTAPLEESWRKECAARYLNYILKNKISSKTSNIHASFQKMGSKRKMDESEISERYVNKEDLMKLLRSLLQTPNEYINIFLRALLLAADAESKLNEISRLIDIYNGRLKNAEEDEEMEVHSLRTLLGESYPEPTAQESNEIEMEYVEDQESEWSRVPFGRLPWQTEDKPWILIYQS